MRLFITGATGFIGANLLACEKFTGHELICLARPDSENIPVSPHNRVKVHKGPVSANDLTGCDAVIFLAGRAHKMDDRVADPLAENRAVNRDLALSLAAVAIEAGIPKFIYLSSVKAFGEATSHGTIIDENYPASPCDPYGISKMEAEEGLARLYAGRHGAHCVVLRIPMVYGPMNKGNMVSLLKSALRGRWLPLGAAKGKRSMLYVENLCDAIVTILARPSAAGIATYYLTDGVDMASAELYEEIYAAFGRQNGVYYLPERMFRVAGAIGSLCERLFSASLPINRGVVSRLFDDFRFSSEKFRRDYGWQAPFTPGEGMRRTATWYRAIGGESSNRQVPGHGGIGRK